MVLGSVGVAHAAAWPYDCAKEKRTGLWQDPDTKLWWECKQDSRGVWGWVPIIRRDSLGVGGTGKAAYTNQSSTYGNSFTASGLGTGGGGGWAETYTRVLYDNGTPLSRPMAVRIILKKWDSLQDRFYTCRDTQWVHSSSSTWRMGLRMNMYTQPDCGNGSYTVNSYGLYWSYTLGRWLGGWVNSGGLTLPPSCNCLLAPSSPPAELVAEPAGPDFTNPTLPQGTEVIE